MLFLLCIHSFGSTFKFYILSAIQSVNLVIKSKVLYTTYFINLNLKSINHIESLER